MHGVESKYVLSFLWKFCVSWLLMFLSSFGCVFWFCLLGLLWGVVQRGVLTLGVVLCRFCTWATTLLCVSRDMALGVSSMEHIIYLSIRELSDFLDGSRMWHFGQVGQRPLGCDGAMAQSPCMSEICESRGLQFCGMWIW